MDSEEKWINIGIAVSVAPEKREGMEKLLKLYADELGWEVSSREVPSEKEKRAEVLISPASRTISPSELNERINKVAGVSFGILKDIVFRGDREKALKHHLQGTSLTAAVHPGTKKEFLFLGHTIGFLWFNYELSNRLALEKENPELARSLFFGQTAEEQLRDLFRRKKPEENDAKLKEALEKKYGINLKG